MIAACVKVVGERLTPADQAAVELALRAGEATGARVEVVSVGPPEDAGPLRDLIAAGVDQATLIDSPEPPPSWEVAAALADHLRGVGQVWCGDLSADRGSGSVPAFLAELLGAQQALGLVEVAIEGGTVEGVRRLDGGRRELLRVDGPAVLSVEGAAATLRRASLRAGLAARSAHVQRLVGPRPAHLEPPVVPYRPRARALAAPAGAGAGERTRSLLFGSSAPRRGAPRELAPAAAAATIIDSLTEWGYL